MYYLSKNPESQNKIFSEVSEFQSTILSDDLVNATYTKGCVQESFRICPTAFCLARILEEEMIISGYSLKPGVRNCLKLIYIVFNEFVDYRPLSYVTHYLPVIKIQISRIHKVIFQKDG